MLKFKSVHDAIKKEDGIRILVTRYLGFFLKKSRYTVWLANLGPSENLLKAFQVGKMNWSTFQQSYKSELFNSADLDRNNRTIKNYGQKFTLKLIKELAQGHAIALMCHCDTNEKECHLRVIEQIMRSRVV